MLQDSKISDIVSRLIFNITPLFKDMKMVYNVTLDLPQSKGFSLYVVNFFYNFDSNEEFGDKTCRFQ